MTWCYNRSPLYFSLACVCALDSYCCWIFSSTVLVGASVLFHSFGSIHLLYEWCLCDCAFRLTVHSMSTICCCMCMWIVSYVSLRSFVLFRSFLWLSNSALNSVDCDWLLFRWLATPILTEMLFLFHCLSFVFIAIPPHTHSHMHTHKCAHLFLFYCYVWMYINRRQKLS